MISPVSKETTRNLVYQELKHALLSGAFEPGQIVIAREVAEEMRVGVTPVRESIQQLITEGGLELLPSRTIRVPVLESMDFQEIFEIRIKLEALAAESAATKMDDQEIIQLRTLARAVVLPTDGASAATSLEANLAFHFFIYRAARMRHVYEIIERLWLKVGPLLVLSYHASIGDQTAFSEALAMHDRLIGHFENRDAEAAGETMRRLLQHSRDWYAAQLFG